MPVSLHQYISDASRQTMEGVTATLSAYLKQKKWLDALNVYQKDCVKKIQTDLKVKNLQSKHLIEYIAAAVFLHCVDGWTVLGKALASCAKGDANNTRHLAYYAELRAAMSLLGSEGIAVFDHQHFIVDRRGDLHHYPKNLGTHDFVWDALKEWAATTKSAQTIQSIIAPSGIVLADWLNALGTSSHPITSDWLSTWGLDLKRMKEDRSARNESSYRPTYMINNGALSLKECVDFMSNVWQLCEPSHPNRFESMDKWLLRLAVQATQTASGTTSFYKNIEGMLDTLNIIGSTKDVWLKFFREKPTSTSSRVFDFARMQDDVYHPIHHIQVFSRALLLLRLATGSAALLLTKAGIDTKDFNFWWNGLCIERGIVEIGKSPSNVIDLWADVEAAIDELKNFNTLGSDLFVLHQQYSRQISVLTECERVAFWGIGL